VKPPTLSAGNSGLILAEAGDDTGRSVVSVGAGACPSGSGGNVGSCSGVVVVGGMVVVVGFGLAVVDGGTVVAGGAVVSGG
jgi:hypothetical protein